MSEICFNRYRRKRPGGREYFRLGAESYSSLERVGKKEKKIFASTFGQIRLWTSFESSPVSVKLISNAPWEVGVHFDCVHSGGLEKSIVFGADH